MKFYSGFSLKNEQSYLYEYINSSEYSVSGFSYGCIKALKYTQEQLKGGKRVDMLQLFSPAFFQNKDEKFKRLQLMSYKKSEQNYLKNFIGLCFAPYSEKKVEHTDTTADTLYELLNYKWDIKELIELKNMGVAIEVYLGGEDKIIDAKDAKEFFLQVATVTYINSANHFLQVS